MGEVHKENPFNYVHSIRVSEEGWCDTFSLDSRTDIFPSCKTLVKKISSFRKSVNNVLQEENSVDENLQETDDEVALKSLIFADGLTEAVAASVNEICKMGLLNIDDKRSPALRTQMTLNSIRTITPIVIGMLNHPDRLNPVLFPDKNDKTKKYYKKPALMITCNCYDIISSGAMRLIGREMGSILGTRIPKRSCNLPDLRKLVVIPVFPFVLKFKPGLERDDQLRDATCTIDSTCTHWHIDQYILQPIFNECNRISHQQKINGKCLKQKLSNCLYNSGKKQYGSLSIYGSNLSDLSLRDSDVDFSLEVPHLAAANISFLNGNLRKEKLEGLNKKYVINLKNILERSGFDEICPIHRARVPVVKGCDRHANNPCSKDGSLRFDICFQNRIAIANSALVREYAELHEKVKILMVLVKNWVRAQSIGSAVGGTLSSYSWMNLTVFFLQCIGYIPSLQSKDLMTSHGVLSSGTNMETKTIDGLDCFFLKASFIKKEKLWIASKEMEEIPISCLVCNFFHFYTIIFDHPILAISIRLGRSSLLKATFENAKFWRVCIEDPFETHHCRRPHDLGACVNRKGQALILRKLKDAAASLKSSLVSPVSSINDNTINTLFGQSPTPDSIEVHENN
mmetsp:Transcript_65884/g.77420  ORF Transcript_65884/g.77420 Transcript_65884/m.77420 type:complete len:626 (-) Transcript_65884:143-2020(-)